MKLRRRKVAVMVRLIFAPGVPAGPARPVTRMRNVPVRLSSMDDPGLAVSHVAYPLAGISSIAYWSLVPGTVRQLRGSAPTPFHGWFTALVSVPLGSGTLVHFVQYALSWLRWKA